MNTIYHSNWNNAGDHYFPITLTYNFAAGSDMDYLIYYPRTSGPNGNFKEVEIRVKSNANTRGTDEWKMCIRDRTITGSIQSVRPSDLLVPSANLSSSFAGRLSGVIAYQRSGEPGQNSADFFIRGVATMNGATSPLIILDGVEVSKADLNSLDPEVIESFSVLKLSLIHIYCYLAGTLCRICAGELPQRNYGPTLPPVYYYHRCIRTDFDCCGADSESGHVFADSETGQWQKEEHCFP